MDKYILSLICNKYILSLICFVRIDFSEEYHIEGDAMSNPFRTKYINDSMFIKDLVTWPFYWRHIRKQWYYVNVMIVTW